MAMFAPCLLKSLYHFVLTASFDKSRPERFDLATAMLTQQKQKIGDFDCVVVKDSECQQPNAVVILCHGFGAPSTDLVSISNELLGRENSNQKVVYVFPAGPIEMDPLFDARAWWMIDVEHIQQLMMKGETRELKTHSPDVLPERRKSMCGLIDHCRVDFNVQPNQILIGGFSQGSMLATDVAFSYPELLGGLIIWSGSLINESEWIEKSKAREFLKIVQSHGRQDPVLPFDGAVDLRDMLRSHGHSVEFHEFGGQHAIPLEAIELAIQLIEGAATVSRD